MEKLFIIWRNSAECEIHRAPIKSFFSHDALPVLERMLGTTDFSEGDTITFEATTVQS